MSKIELRPLVLLYVGRRWNVNSLVKNIILLFFNTGHRGLLKSVNINLTLNHKSGQNRTQ
jgi:hypothetical protein